MPFALPYPFWLHDRLTRFDRLRGGNGFRYDAQLHPGATGARNFLGGIAQLDAPAMFFQNAANDGQAQTRALFPRRHIGLEQARPVFLGQADAVVDHVDDDVFVLAPHADDDFSAAELVRRYRANRFGGVLDDVGERLGNQPPIETRRNHVGRQFDFEVDVGMGDAEQEDRLAHRIGNVLVGHDRLRHAGKARELVDHALDVVDLAHDGIGALVEHRVIGGNQFAVFAAQPLRRQLDRGQRVLDLVGDAAGDVGPGRGTLRQNELGDVVDGDDVAVLGVRRLFAGHAHGEITFLAVARDRDLALYQTLVAMAGGLKNLGELGRDFGQRPAERLALGASGEGLRRTVEDGDLAVGIDADDAGAGARQHGLGETAPAVDQVARAHDVLVLGTQLMRHLVEGLAEAGKVAARTLDRDLHLQIAGRDHVGGADQAADRRHQAIGEIEPDPR